MHRSRRSVVPKSRPVSTHALRRARRATTRAVMVTIQGAMAMFQPTPSADAERRPRQPVTMAAPVDRGAPNSTPSADAESDRPPSWPRCPRGRAMFQPTPSADAESDPPPSRSRPRLQERPAFQPTPSADAESDTLRPTRAWAAPSPCRGFNPRPPPTRRATLATSGAHRANVQRVSTHALRRRGERRHAPASPCRPGYGRSRFQPTPSADAESATCDIAHRTGRISGDVFQPTPSADARRAT